MYLGRENMSLGRHKSTKISDKSLELATLFGIKRRDKREKMGKRNKLAYNCKLLVNISRGIEKFIKRGDTFLNEKGEKQKEKNS